MENRPLFEERYGITYYYFNYKNDLFIVLDPIMNEWNIEGNQLQLLQDLLENQVPNSDNVFIFFHQILWKESHNQFNYIKWNSAAGRGDSVNFWKDVEPMFRFLPNEVYMFAGDLGASWASDVSYDKYDNITLCSSGMGHPDGENFIVVNVHNNKEVSYDLICLSDPNMDCLGELKDHLVVSELLDVNDPIDSNTTNISIHPNPVKNYITINLKQPHNTNIQIFNTQGSLIYEQYYFNQYQFSIDISLLPKGLYFVKSSYLSNIEAVKVIKE